MSSDSEENFDLDVVSDNFNDSESDFGASPKGKRKAKAAPKPKPAPKPKATTTKAKAPAKPHTGAKKPLEPVENVSDDDEVMEIDEDVSDDDKPKTKKAPAKPRADGKTASEKYQKLSDIEHVLKRPDSYIGSVEFHEQEMWIIDPETKKMKWKKIKYVPGFFKIVDEILVNAADNKINDADMDQIKVNIDTEKNLISVYNTGRGIPIEMHTKEHQLIPEMIFGSLLTGSNYDDDEKKLTGGRNGYGAKLANIYSLKFVVETADSRSGQKFQQTFSENMSQRTKPKITSNPKGEDWTRVTFYPDFARFGMDFIDEDTHALLVKRVYDLAGTVKDVKVSLNDKRLPVKNFKSYIDMFITAATEAATEASGGGAVTKPTVFFESSDRWEYAFTLSDSGTFQHVSFANSISTTKGGTHVNAIADQICKQLTPVIEKKNKAAKVKPAQIKNHMWIFVNALIENPTFDSQTKEQLTLLPSKFGSKPGITEDFMKKIVKSQLIERVLNWAKFRSDQLIKKSDGGGRQSRLTGLAKLSDANHAGTKQGINCTLILTEGDSAKALAEAGLSVVGRNNFGVFPLRGKLLNVREATHDQIMKNTEIQNIKKIMGLQHAKDYKDRSSLRYGSLMIMTDQDHDGSHIKGLLINFLDHFYPSLLKIPEFLVEFVTPIVRVTKGKETRNFFTIPEYLEWNEQHNTDGKWSAKYYKGLGTSTNEDAKTYFSDMETHMIPFSALRDDDRPLIDMAFSKKKTDERKEWLRKFVPGTYLDHNQKEISYDEFINKELILFSMADNIRSIPSVVDGLKPGQRKIIFGCFKRKLKAQVKVAQLVGYISENTAYHHGEQSLAMSIIALAQDYVGSNNVNLLSPDGQYGTRFNGGKDAASPRYIFTHIPSVTRTLFHPHDDPILNHLVDDGDVVEPEWYVPVVPTVLLNGAEGIGTGWSTNIPSYNPHDIVDNLRRLMRDEPLVPMVPWYRGYTGAIERHPTDKDKFNVSGIITQLSSTSVEITELPIHKWTENYKEFLESCIVGATTEKAKDKDGKEKEKGDKKPARQPDRFITDYKEHHAGRHIHFIVTMSAEHMAKAVENGLAQTFKLTSTITTSNMMCFDPDGTMKKYTSPEEILEEFYAIRMKYYQKRKAYMVDELQTQVERLSNQARFVQVIIDKKLIVSGRKKVDIVTELREKGFRAFPKIIKAKEAGETAEVIEDDDEPVGANSDYDYLLGMAIWTLTREKVDKLKRDCATKEAELEAFVKRTPEQLWSSDLDAFVEEWEKMLEADAKLESKLGGSTKNKKQATLKTRRSLGSKTVGRKKKGGSDDDSDFGAKPSKASSSKAASSSTAPKARATKAKVAAPVADFMEVDDDEDLKPDVVAKAKAAPKPRAKKAVVKDESEEEDDAVVISRPKPRAAASSSAPAKARAKPKPKAPVDSDEEMDNGGVDDDDDDDLGISSKTKAKASSAASKSKAKPKAILDSEEDDFDLGDEKPKAKSTAAAKGKGKAVKRKSIEEDEDGEEDDEPVAPVAKKAKSSGSAKITLSDFYDLIPKSAPSTAASKVKPKGRVVSTATAKSTGAAAKKTKKKVESDEDEDDDDVDNSPPPIRGGRRPARAAATSSKKYAMSSEQEEEVSAFEISD